MLVKLSVAKSSALAKFLFAALFFKSYLLLFWMVISITLLLFWVVVSIELSMQVTNVLLGFTMVLISVSCLIINVSARFSSLRYSISSVRELMQGKILNSDLLSLFLSFPVWFTPISFGSGVVRYLQESMALFLYYYYYYYYYY